VTIDQYVTHVADALVTDEHILRGTDLRSDRLTMLLEGYAREDDRGPLRLAQKIPVTYPIACTMQRWADKLHTGGQRLATRAAVAVAYGLSLRPGEYLTKPDVALSLDKQMNASDCFFVFNDDECVNVCDPHLYPEGKIPSIFLCMFRKLKHYKRSGREALRQSVRDLLQLQRGFVVCSRCSSTSQNSLASGIHWLSRHMASEGYHGRMFVPCATVRRLSRALIRFVRCLTPFGWPRKRSLRWSVMSGVNSKEVGTPKLG
jgi:hypothetical protein